MRHGETFDNKCQIMQGQTQGELNDAGISQAKELGSRYANEHIDAIVSSDLWRAVQTARIIAEPHGLDIVTTPLLRERDWGSFTGRYIPELKNEVWPDDIESLVQLKDRARIFLNYIRTTFPDKQVLCVGHGIINKAIQAVFFDKEMNQVERMGNAEVRILEMDC